MRAVLGIGNPGAQYADTKHNAGFIILDHFAEKHNLVFKPSKGEYYFAEGNLDSVPYILIKPTTYVNLSGHAALDIINKYSLSPSDLLVIVDDLHLNLGAYRIRKNGGSGGHNGLESIIYELRTDNFPRLRFGIGNNFSEGAQIHYVLSKFTSEEFDIINSKINLVTELIEKFIEGGVQFMLDYNSKISQTINLEVPPNKNNKKE